MERRDRRDDWTLIIAIVLIAVGGWMLFREFFGGWLPLAQIARLVSRVIWPLVLIGAGLLIYFASRNESRPAPIATGRRLYRSRTEKMVGGVLGGLGVYLGVDPTWLRVAFVLLAIAGFGSAVVLYIIAMIIVPEEPVAGAAEPQWPQHPAQSAGQWPAQGSETVQTPPPAPDSAPDEPAQ